MSAPHVTYPREGQSFAVDPDGPSRQELVLTAASTARRVRFVVDGRTSPELSAPFRWPWRLVPGVHRVVVQADNSVSEAVSFEVREP